MTSQQRIRPHSTQRTTQTQAYAKMLTSAGVEGGWLSRPSGRIHVIAAGQGPPVVHLHGSNTSSLSHLMLLEHLTAVRSYLVDRPGFGLSDPVPFHRDDYRAYATAFVDEVLDLLELNTAVLVGASAGGAWATWYALAHPERVRGLVALGSIPLFPGAKIPLPLRLAATPVLGPALGRAVTPGRRIIVQLMKAMGEGDTILRHPDLLDSLVTAARDPFAAAANAAELRALLSPLGARASLRLQVDELRRLAVPTLLICGDHDPVLPPAAAYAAADVLRHGRIITLPAGHVPQLGNPRRVAELITEWTDRYL